MEAAVCPSPKDYYKVLEVDYDATEEIIRLNYRKLALKWHPDKHRGDPAVTAKFQEINEAYKERSELASASYTDSSLMIRWILSDPDKRFDYDLTGIYEIDKYTLHEYLARFKELILTCNGLGIDQTQIWSQQLAESIEFVDK